MSNSTILKMEGVRKTFGPLVALDNVNLELKSKEIKCLLGGNGAGKTTLMNILFGLYKSDAGNIFLHGERVTIQSPKDAIRNRIGMVHQHFLQIDSYSVTENIVLGTPLKNKPTLNLTEQEAKIVDLSERFGISIDPKAMIEELPMGVRQKVEILKALFRGVEILVLDEPTTNLTPQEVDSLFHSLQAMVDVGLSIVFITHKLKEALSVCDTISVLRDGKNVFDLLREEATEEILVRAMVGEGMAIESSLVFSKPEFESKGEPATILTDTLPEKKIVLSVEELQVTSEDGATTILKDCSFKVAEKEILGIAGVAGNGQLPLAEAILRIRPTSHGRIQMDGEDIGGLKTRELLEKGVSYIPEDRMHDGYLPSATIAQNMILGSHRGEPYSKRGFLNWKTIFQATDILISEYDIMTPSASEIAANLSGGNIQRVMLARAFSRPVRLLIAHNPTRGLDIKSTDFVYSKILERKKERMATLLISEDLDELILLCDRIATIYRGAIVGILNRADFDRYEIGRMMSGVSTSD